MISFGLFVAFVLDKLSSVLANICSVKDSLRDERESRRAVIDVKYSRASSGKNPGFIVSNIGKHEATNVHIEADPPLNFEPYKGNNYYDIPCLAPGFSKRITYFHKRLDQVTLILTYKDVVRHKNKRYPIKIR